MTVRDVAIINNASSLEMSQIPRDNEKQVLESTDSKYPSIFHNEFINGTRIIISQIFFITSLRRE